MAAMYNELGADGTVGTTTVLEYWLGHGSNLEATAELLTEMREGLAAASRSGDLPSSFARDLVRYSVLSVLDPDAQGSFTSEYQQWGNGASILEFYLREGDYSDDFFGAALDELDEFERQSEGAPMWNYPNGQFPLNGIGLDSATGPRTADPMAAALGRTADYPDTVQDFWTDRELGDERQQYYFEQRDWSDDGFVGVTDSVLALWEREEITAPNPEVSSLVGAFAGYIPDNEAFDVQSAQPASSSMARLLSLTMPSVREAMLGTVAGTDLSEHTADMLGRSGYPDIDDQPFFERGELDALAAVALSSEEGRMQLASAVAADRVATLAYENLTSDTPGYQGLLETSAQIEGFFRDAITDAAAARGGQRDQMIAGFTTAVGVVTSSIPVPGADMVGDAANDFVENLYKNAIKEIYGLPASHLTSEVGGSEAAARTAEVLQSADEAYAVAINSVLPLIQMEAVNPTVMGDHWDVILDGGTLADASREQLEQMMRDSQAWMNNPSFLAEGVSVDMSDIMNEYAKEGGIDPSSF